MECCIKTRVVNSPGGLNEPLDSVTSNPDFKVTTIFNVK